MMMMMLQIWLMGFMFIFTSPALGQPATGDVVSAGTLGDTMVAQQAKVFPEGFHDFVPPTGYRPAVTRSRDVFCSDWRKILSLHKRIRELEKQGRTKAEAYELSLNEVNDANRPARVCWWDDHEDTTEAVATRGYVEIVEGKEVLRPVRIHRFRNGLYVGYHSEKVAQ